MNAAVEMTLKLLREHPEELEFNEYTASNTRVGVTLWITNLPLDCKTYDSRVSFSIGLIDRFRLYFAARKARNVSAAIRIKLTPPKTAP